MSLNYDKIREEAASLQRKAKDGTLTIGKVKYHFKFNHYAGVYNVTWDGGSCNLNTRSLKTARAWMREWETS